MNTSGSDGKESACNAGDWSLIPELGRSLGEENSNQLQYSSLENPMDRNPMVGTVHGVAKSQTGLSTHIYPTPHTHTHTHTPISINMREGKIESNCSCQKKAYIKYKPNFSLFLFASSI